MDCMPRPRRARWLCCTCAPFCRRSVKTGIMITLNNMNVIGIVAIPGMMTGEFQCCIMMCLCVSQLVNISASAERSSPGSSQMYLSAAVVRLLVFLPRHSLKQSLKQYFTTAFVCLLKKLSRVYFVVFLLLFVFCWIGGAFPGVPGYILNIFTHLRSLVETYITLRLLQYHVMVNWHSRPYRTHMGRQ